ncbi:hypothetical protein EBZ37_15485, partial [bacterium]|nr:hypothetical protein [bacterium]
MLISYFIRSVLILGTFWAFQAASQQAPQAPAGAPSRVVRTLFADASCSGQGQLTVTNLWECLKIPRADPRKPQQWRRLSWLFGEKNVDGQDTYSEVLEEIFSDFKCSTPPTHVTKRFYPAGSIDQDGAPHCFSDAANPDSFYLHF